MILEHSNAAPHIVQQTKSYWGKLKVNQHMVLTLHSGLLILCQWHNAWEITNCTTRRTQDTKLYHDSFETLAKTRQARQCAVCWVKKWSHLSEIIELYFVLLWLSFKLSVWHKERHCLDSLHCHMCCFISQSEVKFSLWYNCSGSLKFTIYGPDCKICIYIESGLFP